MAEQTRIYTASQVKTQEEHIRQLHNFQFLAWSLPGFLAFL